MIAMKDEPEIFDRALEVLLPSNWLNKKIFFCLPTSHVAMAANNKGVVTISFHKNDTTVSYRLLSEESQTANLTRLIKEYKYSRNR